jgi:hypothetical protein
MKTRNGFVSNSSSSSFIAVGVKRSTLPEFEVKEEDEEFFYDAINIGEGDLIGTYLACWDDTSELYDMELSSEKIEEAKDKFVSNAQRIGVSIKREDIKIYAGTFAC